MLVEVKELSISKEMAQVFTHRLFDTEDIIPLSSPQKDYLLNCI